MLLLEITHDGMHDDKPLAPDRSRCRGPMRNESPYLEELEHDGKNPAGYSHWAKRFLASRGIESVGHCLLSRPRHLGNHAGMNPSTPEYATPQRNTNGKPL